MGFDLTKNKNCDQNKWKTKM